MPGTRPAPGASVLAFINNRFGGKSRYAHTLLSVKSARTRLPSRVRAIIGAGCLWHAETATDGPARRGHKPSAGKCSDPDKYGRGRWSSVFLAVVQLLFKLSPLCLHFLVFCFHLFHQVG